ncbi:MAG: hypothetical protein AB1589_36465 [Cyanobacteriota bacterium]
MAWKKLCVKATIWLATEIVLNLLGLDNLADYSEFLFEKEVAFVTPQPQLAVVVPPRRPLFNYNVSYRFTLGINA